MILIGHSKTSYQNLGHLWHLCLETSLLLNRIRILTGEKAVIISALLLSTRAYLHSLLNFLTVSQSPACHTGHGPMLHCA